MNIDKLMGNQTSVQVSKMVSETDSARTIQFKMSDPEFKVSPGQFLMVWIPGVDEIPMSISLWDSAVVGITVLSIGEATSSLVSLQKGDWIGIRGPFGSSFTLDSKKALVVGGGIGMAPLRPLVYELLEKGTDVTLLIAARTANELVFLEEFSNLSDKGFTLMTSTDDGSSGFKGFATDSVQEELDVRKYDTLYTCGPELMMFGLFDQVRETGVRFQASLERFMKCGCGICGTCAMDPTGTLVCVDGPIYSDDQLSEISEFGKYHRDAMGLKKSF
ncbi:MAG: dihydroorotate dehydrogenase electron transfer subunit [Candidatus Thorarchaeota archaeon]|jgi:dihydroorotate dehydrogenase electron transfer subunit